MASVRPEAAVLLVIALVVVWAGWWAPLWLGVYWLKATAAAAKAAILAGTAVRVVCHSACGARQMGTGCAGGGGILVRGREKDGKWVNSERAAAARRWCEGGRVGRRLPTR